MIVRHENDITENITGFIIEISYFMFANQEAILETKICRYELNLNVKIYLEDCFEVTLFSVTQLKYS